jgi:hypothetical protein
MKSAYVFISHAAVLDARRAAQTPDNATDKRAIIL